MKFYVIQMFDFLVMKSLQLKLFRWLFQILKAIAGELEFLYLDSYKRFYSFI